MNPDMTQTVAPTSISLDKEHYELLIKLRSKIEAEEKKHTSISSIFKLALRELAKVNGV